MDDFLGRIGLGCARLSGGVAESNSRRVVAVALKSGIRYFDTAPSYGGGASERILAAELHDVRDEVQLCTKVGLSRASPNAKAELKTLMLATIRSVLPEAVIGRLNQTRHRQERSLPEQSANGNFETAFVRSSVSQSLNELQTDRLDCLLLHEPRVSDPNPELTTVLREFVAAGTAGQIGVATGSDIEHLSPFGDVAQFKIGAMGLVASTDPRRRIGHGLLRGLDYALIGECAHQARIFEHAPAIKSCLSEPLGSSALLLNAVLFGSKLDRVLVSTTSPTRLDRFIETAKTMYEEIRACGRDEYASAFRKFVHQYFSKPINAG